MMEKEASDDPSSKIRRINWTRLDREAISLRHVISILLTAVLSREIRRRHHSMDVITVLDLLHCPWSGVEIPIVSPNPFSLKPLSFYGPRKNFSLPSLTPPWAIGDYNHLRRGHGFAGTTSAARQVTNDNAMTPCWLFSFVVVVC